MKKRQTHAHRETEVPGIGWTRLADGETAIAQETRPGMLNEGYEVCLENSLGRSASWEGQLTHPMQVLLPPLCTRGSHL